MTRQRVSPGPRDPTPAYANPEVEEVRDLETGEEHDSQTFIRSFPYEDGVRLRLDLRERVRSGRPPIVCAICSKPVYSRATINGEFYFWHAHVDGSCPRMDMNRLTAQQIRQIKYKGAQESVPHRLMKERIERSLLADSEFSDVLVEKTWHSTQNLDDLRRPDVSARRGKLRIAFEAQLSTTSLGVVFERREFYSAEGALLVWFLPTFDPSDRRITHDDIFFNNNANVLVIDEETEAASIASRKFTVRCHYCELHLEGGVTQVEWQSRLVTWDELTCDPALQHCFFFDYGAKRASVLEAIRNAADAESERAEAAARDWARKKEEAKDLKFKKLAIAILIDREWKPTQEFQSFTKAWTYLQFSLQARGIVLDSHNSEDFNNLSLMVRTFASAMKGQPVGFDPSFRLIQIAHNLAQNAPGAVPMFECILRVFGFDDELAKQDRFGKWQKRRSSLSNAPLPSNLFRAAAVILDLPAECIPQVR